MQLVAHDVKLGYGSRTVIEKTSLSLRSDEITVIIGPNGSGKSTLLGALSGQLSPQSGDVHLGDRPLSLWGRRALARELAFLPQHPQAPDEIRVRDLVSYGRFAHRRPFARLHAVDHAAIDQALADTDTERFADRPLSALSGGEKQRVWIALSLAQSPRMLLLDEPTSFLDLGYQYQLLDLLKELNRKNGLGIAMVLHDINQASLYADRVIVLNQGRLIADGSSEEVVTPARIEDLFGIPVRTLQSPGLNRPICLPAHL